jgi:secreted PhoX family phosphatase
MKIDRRRFLERSGACLLGAAAGFATGSFAGASPGGRGSSAKASAGPGFGPLRKDPEGLLDLPAGFSCTIVSVPGRKMADGFIAPSLADGSAALPGPDGLTLLVRNHEFRVGHSDDLGPFGGKKKLWKNLDRGVIYDWRPDGTPCLGSVTTTVYDTKLRKTVRQHLSLAGTMTNCSGGPTPWGTWLSSEEVFLGPGESCEGRHGYTFEVPVSAAPGIAAPRPLKALGRFGKEGAAVDPRTGIVYQTEDLVDGLFYRFLPASPGRLAEGGRLQALSVAGRPGFETNNWRTRTIEDGRVFEADWIDLDDPDPDEDVLRLRGRAKGAAVFASGEGLVYREGTLVFACTNGGTRGKGQVWRYVPSPGEGTPREKDEPGRLDLRVEPDDASILDHPDQLAVTPWGDLLVCEDGDGDNFVLGLTPDWAFYRFARFAAPGAEPSGACFSPDRTTLFLNNLTAGVTVAVTGPWK